MARTPKAQALGRLIRQLRDEAKLSTRGLGELLGVNPGTVSRWETGDRAPKPEEVARMLTKLNVSDDLYNEIMTMVHDLFRSEWVAITRQEQRQQMAAFVEFERESSKITAQSPIFVPGMLQTRGYVEGIMSKSDLTAGEKAEQIDRRLKRKENLCKKRETPHYRALIGTAAVQLIVGSRAVMAEQIRHMIEMARL
jgi:transcriptional regulator with XRE-family HTH domain